MFYSQKLHVRFTLFTFQVNDNVYFLSSSCFVGRMNDLVVILGFRFWPKLLPLCVEIFRKFSQVVE